MDSPLKLLGALAAIAISVPVIVYTVAQETAPPPPPPPPPPPSAGQPAAPPPGSPGPMGPAMGAAPIVTGNQAGAQPAPGAPTGPQFGPSTTGPMSNEPYMPGAPYGPNTPGYQPGQMGPGMTSTAPMGSQQMGPTFGPTNCLPMPSTPLQCASGEYTYYPPTTDPNACPSQPYCRRSDTASQFPQASMMNAGQCPLQTPPQCGSGMYVFYPSMPAGGGCPPSPYCKSSSEMTQPGIMGQCPSQTPPQCGPNQYVYYPPAPVLPPGGPTVVSCPPTPYCRSKDEAQQPTTCTHYPPPSVPCAMGEYMYYPPLPGGCTGAPYCKKSETAQPVRPEGLTSEKCTMTTDCKTKPAGWCDQFYGYCRYPVSAPQTDTIPPTQCPPVAFPTCGNGQYLHYPPTPSGGCPVNPICMRRNQVQLERTPDQQRPQPYPDQQQPMQPEMGTMPVPKQELKWAQRDVKQLVKDLNRASTLVKKVSPALQQEADALAKQVEGYKATFAGKEVTQEQMQEYRDAMMQDAMQGIRTRAETLQMLSKEVPRELKRVRGAGDPLTRTLAKKNVVKALTKVGVSIESLAAQGENSAVATEVEFLYKVAVETPTMENIETAQQALQGMREQQHSPDEDRERAILSQAVNQFTSAYATPFVRIEKKGDAELTAKLMELVSPVVEALNNGEGDSANEEFRNLHPAIRSLFQRASAAKLSAAKRISILGCADELIEGEAGPVCVKLLGRRVTVPRPMPY